MNEETRVATKQSDVVKGQRMTKAEWTSVVQNMVARGASASDAEVQAIIEYLARTWPR